MQLKQSDIDLLEWAINEAAAWRGYFCGEQRKAYEAEIEACRESLQKVKQLINEDTKS